MSLRVFVVVFCAVLVLYSNVTDAKKKKMEIRRKRWSIDDIVNFLKKYLQMIRDKADEQNAESEESDDWDDWDDLDDWDESSPSTTPATTENTDCQSSGPARTCLQSACDNVVADKVCSNGNPCCML